MRTQLLYHIASLVIIVGTSGASGCSGVMNSARYSASQAKEALGDLGSIDSSQASDAFQLAVNRGSQSTALLFQGLHDMRPYHGSAISFDLTGAFKNSDGSVPAERLTEMGICTEDAEMYGIKTTEGRGRTKFDLSGFSGIMFGPLAPATGTSHIELMLMPLGVQPEVRHVCHCLLLGLSGRKVMWSFSDPKKSVAQWGAILGIPGT